MFSTRLHFGTISLLISLIAAKDIQTPAQNSTFSLPPSLTAPLAATSTCYIPGGNIKNVPVLEHCYTAIRLVLAERSIVEPRHFSGGKKAQEITVPFFRAYKSCMFVLDTSDPTDEEDFLLIRAAYFAAELTQPCIARQKVPLGGRSLIEAGSFFIAIIGAPGDADGSESSLPALLKAFRNETGPVEIQ